MIFQFIVVALCLLPLRANAIAPLENRLATGQGVAAPSMDTLVNLSRGFTSENAAGVMYQDGFRVVAQYAKNGVSDTGFEAGYSGKTFGIAAGMFKPGCDDCKATNSGILGANVTKDIAIGARYSVVDKTPTMGLGLLFNTLGTHRVGINGEQTNPEGELNNTTSYGAGYAYVSKENTIALEVSKRKYENTATEEASGKIMIGSLSYQRRVGDLAASLSYERRMDDDAVEDNPDTFWMGAGFNSNAIHLGVYVAYHLEMLAVLSGFF